MRRILLLLVMMQTASAQSIMVSGSRQSLVVSGVAESPSFVVSEPSPVLPNAEIERLRLELSALKLQMSQPLAAVGKPVLHIWVTTNCPPCGTLKVEIERGCFGGCLLAWEKGSLPSGVAGYPAIQYTDKNGVQQTHVGWTSGDAGPIRAALGLPPLKQYAETQEIAVTARDASPAYRSQWPPRWNVEGVWNGSRDFYLRHLRTNPNHRNKFWQSWPLETWSREQLAALHDDDHVGRVRRTITVPTGYQTVSRPVYRSVVRSSSSCPNGRCPSPSFRSVRSSCPNGMCPTF